MFKKEGENMLKSLKKGQENTKQADKETEKKKGKVFFEPPYLPKRESSQFSREQWK